jgi:ribosomal protein S18 acetylase RimI-like enzyme
MAELEIRAATVADWPVCKQIRLRALADAPSAFSSTLAREAAFDDAEWQRRVEPGTWLLAWSDGRPVGMAVTLLEDGLPTQSHLVGMWVEAEFRGTAAATELVETACVAARSAGGQAVTLWVADPNRRARRFYERLGFRPTGEHQPLPSNPEIGEERMRRDL